jgi:NADPH2:quinone reductase
LAKAIRFDRTGGPEVLYLQECEAAQPGPGQVQLAHKAVGLNYADTYFRSGIYPVPLPSGIGVEAAGVVTAVGEGVTEFAAGDRVTYTGFTNTLGAYSSTHVVPANALIALPDAIDFETAACITMRGLTSAYLMRRIYDFQPGQSILLHAAAGGVGLIVTQWAKLLGLTVMVATMSSTTAARQWLRVCVN